MGLVRNRCLQLPLGCIQGGSCCPGRVVERERARWHDPVLGRWLGLTPEQPALCLRGFPRRPRAAPSRVSDPPGLSRRQGAQGAARGAVREKRYNLPDPGVHHTNWERPSSHLTVRYHTHLQDRYGFLPAIRRLNMATHSTHTPHTTSPHTNRHACGLMTTTPLHAPIHWAAAASGRRQL